MPQTDAHIEQYEAERSGKQGTATGEIGCARLPSSFLAISGRCVEPELFSAAGRPRFGSRQSLPLSIAGVNQFLLAPKHPAAVRFTVVAKKKLTKSVEQALKELGRLGGQTRARRLTSEQRSEIARKAALARWRRAK